MSLPNVYLRAPPTPPAAALQQRDDFVALVQRLAAQRATMLTEIEQLLVDLVRLGNVRSELKALLIKQLGSLGQVRTKSLFFSSGKPFPCLPLHKLTGPFVFCLFVFNAVGLGQID